MTVPGYVMNRVQTNTSAHKRARMSVIAKYV